MCLDQWFRRCFKLFLFYSSGRHLVWRIKSICAISAKAVIGNIHKKFLIWTNGSEGIKEKKIRMTHNHSESGLFLLTVSVCDFGMAHYHNQNLVKGGGGLLGLSG